MKRPSEQLNRLSQRITTVLWQDWDPAGIKAIAPSDEYQSYTTQLIRLITQGVSRDELAQKLFRIENDLMVSLDNFQTFERCQEVADKILAVTERLL